MTDNEFDGASYASEAPAVEQKMLPQSEVSAIVKREREAAMLKVRREYEAQAQTQVQPPVIDEDAIVERTAAKVFADAYEGQEKARVEQEQAESLRKSQEYNNKLVAALKDDDVAEDFEAVMRKFPHKDFPGLRMAGISELPNLKHVMYALAKNLVKAAGFETLARTSPTAFKDAIKDYADSVEQNRMAATTASKVKEPLSRLKPKSVGVDSGKKAPVDSDPQARLDALKQKYIM